MRYVANASPEEQAAIRRAQDQMDRQQADWKELIRRSEPDPREMRNLQLMNLTLVPKIKFTQLALTWMQRSPQAWGGWYPENCEPVAKMLDIGEDV